MSYDEFVMPTLDAMQNMCDYYAEVWFLNHQNKQDFMGENKKPTKVRRRFLIVAMKHILSKKGKKRKPPNRNA